MKAKGGWGHQPWRIAVDRPGNCVELGRGGEAGAASAGAQNIEQVVLLAVLGVLSCILAVLLVFFLCSGNSGL